MCVWYFGAGWVEKRLDVAVYAVLSVKIVGGITLLCFRGLRAYGAGLLSSLPLGVMIFIVGTCAQAAKR